MILLEQAIQEENKRESKENKRQGKLFDFRKMVTKPNRQTYRIKKNTNTLMTKKFKAFEIRLVDRISPIKYQRLGSIAIFQEKVKINNNRVSKSSKQNHKICKEKRETRQS